MMMLVRSIIVMVRLILIPVVVLGGVEKGVVPAAVVEVYVISTRFAMILPVTFMVSDGMLVVAIVMT
jgi:hypothetical protein